jgi:hypothetical protein
METLFVLDNGDTFIIPDNQDISYWEQQYPYKSFRASNVIDEKSITVLSKVKKLEPSWPWKNIGYEYGTWGYALSSYLKDSKNELALDSGKQ